MNPKKLIIPGAVIISAIACVLILVFMLKKPEVDGWQDKNNHRFYYEKGKIITGFHNIDNKDYIFTNEGYLYEGWFEYEGVMYYQAVTGIYKGDQSIEGKKYHFEDDGSFVSGMYEKDGKEYLNDEYGFPTNGKVSYKGSIYWTEKGMLMSGWKKADDTLQYFDLETYVLTVGLKEIEGDKYYFNNSGNCQYGWVQFDEGNRYFGDDGKMVSGHQFIEEIEYYFSADGIMITGEFEEDNKHYYYDENGAKYRGWREVEGGKIYCDATDGSFVSGWQKIEDDTYFFDDKFLAVTSWQLIEGETYFFNADCKLQTGWQTKEDKRVYLDEEGKLVTNKEVVVDGEKYNLGEDGTYKTGWIENVYYKNGYVKSGLLEIEGKYYFLNDEGKVQTGWQTIGNGKHYFYENGQAATGLQTVDGSKYYFGADGLIKTGLITVGGKQYYFGNDGIMLFNTVVGQYYINADGVAVDRVAEENRLMRAIIAKYAEGKSIEGISPLINELNNYNERLSYNFKTLLEYWVETERSDFVNYEIADNWAKDDSLCIVILGYELNADGTPTNQLVGRLKTGLEVANKYPNARIMVTGGGTAARSDATEGEVMRKWLIDNGVSSDRIYVEKKSTTTSRNAVWSVDIIKEKCPQVKQYVIVSSDYHVAHGCLLFETKLAVEYNLAASDSPRIVGNVGYKCSGRSFSREVCRESMETVFKLSGR